MDYKLGFLIVVLLVGGVITGLALSDALVTLTYYTATLK